MARFTYTILSRSHPGREEELVAWYRDQHLADVCRMPGVIGGQLFRMDFQRVYELDDAPQWTLMTIYELEGDAPEPIIDSIRAASGSANMPACEALNKGGMIQAAGHALRRAAHILRDNDMSEAPHLLVTQEDAILIATFNRPEKLNAMSMELMALAGGRRVAFSRYARTQGHADPRHGPLFFGGR